MDIVQTYNPANLNITEQEIAAMQNLTPAQVEELSKAYPNQPTGNAYLVLLDKSEPDAKKQKFPLSTWKNLNNLYKYGQMHYVPYSFKKQFQRTAVQNQKQAPQRTVDLSQEDLKNAEGLKSKEDVARAEAFDAIQRFQSINLNPGTKNVDASTANNIQPPAENQNEVSPDLKALYDERQKLIDDKAHHMSIKSVQTKIDALENKTVA